MKENSKDENLEETKNDLLKRFASPISQISILQKEMMQAISQEIHEFPHSDKLKSLELDIFKQVGEIFTGKWMVEIIYALVRLGNPFFNDLKQEIQGIGSRILTDRLRFLENQQVVERKIFETSPVRVNYTLTNFGWGYVSLMQAIVLFYIQNTNNKKP
ncbi:hypothetical protein NEF87_001033 [Candidatus Lokiarchaeum ossiferum]|uniref:HTH hxlR-type domain-containing protein n=1 Tax=Candidatus Lokiarchaeum ossiferum TaxID=2951803 RepID=A0ABY6HN68_9ARCH|nr:hypothetical protein NEF87_001033 [Candidatus Lokiarchaeum sp. B-35]